MVFILFFCSFPSHTDELDSYMFQSVGHRAIKLYAEAMNLPLFRQDIKGTAVEQGKDYQPSDGDEVEDLYQLLGRVQVGISWLVISFGKGGGRETQKWGETH